MQVDRTIDTDVLVIGGGGAACRAAVAAHDAGARTVLALKGELGTSGATVAPGRGVAWQVADGCSAPEDSPEIHLQNTLDAGLGMADPRLARILAYELIERTFEMERWGLQFVPSSDGDKKRHFTAYSCFGDHTRAHCILNSGHGHAGDIVMVLKRQVEARDIPVHENVFVTDLLVDEGVCRGALALGPDGDVITYRAGAVVLGTGGARQIFPPSAAHRIDTTGDGYAMAFRSAAELTNMEFAQFMLHVVVSRPMTVPGHFWALFPRLVNSLGDDALSPYLPAGITHEQVMWDRTLHAPFSCRDASAWLDIAVTTELREGRGSPEGGIYADFSKVDLGRFTPSRPMHMPQDYSVKPVLPDGPAQVRDMAHAINGGLRIDERAESTISGLYAAGETAAGPHGADRLGGGMVTNCQVYGARAGRFAAEHARAVGDHPLPRAAVDWALGRLEGFGRGEADADDVFRQLAATAGRNLMVVRNARGLEETIAAIGSLREEVLPRVAVGEGRLLRRAIEADNSLLVAELMARAALRRQESRGSHYREDHPTRNDADWRVNIFLRPSPAGIETTTGVLADRDSR